MGIPHSITKTLAAAAANNVAASQSPAAGAILINGSASNRVSTTTTAATAAGIQGTSNILALTTVTGIVAGSAISDTTAPGVIPAGTTVVGIDTANSKVILSQPVGGAGVGSGDTIVIGGVATLDTARRIIVTSGGVDTGITFTIFGTAQNGTPIQETVTGASGGASAQTNQDFLTVTAVTHTGSVNTTVTVGTNGAGSTPWFPLNVHAQPFNVELSGIVTGTVNWTWQYTYDDPNNLPAGILFPQAFSHPTLNNQTVSLDGSINDPVAAIRLVVNSNTPPGSVRGTWIETGISGQ